MPVSGDKAGPRFPRQWIIRVIGSAIVLGLIFWLLPTDELWRAIVNLPPALWLAVLGVFVAGHVVAAAKWWLLAVRDSGIPFATAVRAHFAGLVANLCLPGVAGGDVVRATLVLRGSDDKTRIAVGSLGDRLLDSFGLLLLATGGALFAIDGADWWAGPLPRIAALAAIVLAGVGLAVVLAPRLPRKGVVAKIADAVGTFRRQPARLMFCLLLSLAVQAIFISLNIALAAACGLDVSAAAWFFAWPLAKLLAVAPISIGGLGVREAGLAALLAPFGAPAAIVVAVGLIWQTILIAGGLIGGGALALSRRITRPVSGNIMGHDQ